MLLQDLLDGVRGDDVPEALERALDAVIAPGQVLAGHSDHEFSDPLHHELSIRLPVRESPLLRDELLVPALERLWRDDRRELVEELAAEGDATHGEPDAIVVAESELPAAELRLEDAVLLARVFEDKLLVAVELAGEDDGEDLKDRRNGAGERSEPTRGRGERRVLMGSAPSS
ncbi:MAG: hypothetical protein EXS13_11735 [Planctomycetes bacterium]|nr:hypothetical protein [Planctomycetota bacterium]